MTQLAANVPFEVSYLPRLEAIDAFSGAKSLSPIVVADQPKLSPQIAQHRAEPWRELSKPLRILASCRRYAFGTFNLLHRPRSARGACYSGDAEHLSALGPHHLLPVWLEGHDKLHQSGQVLPLVKSRLVQ